MPQFVAEFVLPPARLRVDALYATNVLSPTSKKVGQVELVPCFVAPALTETLISPELANAYWHAQQSDPRRDVAVGDSIRLSFAEVNRNPERLDLFGPFPIVVRFADAIIDEDFDKMFLCVGQRDLATYFRMREICPSYTDVCNWCLDLRVEPRCESVAIAPSSGDSSRE